MGSSPWAFDPRIGEGIPAGPPEWPFPGGMLNQPATLVEAVNILRSEWPYVVAAASRNRKGH